MGWGHQAPLRPTAKASIHPGHAVPGTAHVDAVRSSSSEPGQLGWVLSPPCASWASPTSLRLSFLICKLGVVVVTTSQDGYGGKFSENLQDVEQYLTYKKTLSKC